ARHHDEVVDRIGAVHALRHAGQEVQDAEHGAVLDHREAARPRAAVVLAIVVGGRLAPLPDLSPEPLAAALPHTPPDLLDLPDGLAVRVVAGDDAPDGRRFRHVHCALILASRITPPHLFTSDLM